MKTTFIRTAALALASISLFAACKKDEKAPAENVTPQGPVEVAPVPVEQDGVLRYGDETAIGGPAKTNAQVQARKGADATSDVIASLEADATVEKKARRGEFTLVSWEAEAGQPSTGWVLTSALVDQAPEPVILPVDAGTTATDAGTTATDAGAATADAGTDAGQADAPADAGKAQSETTTDAGETAEATTDAGETAQAEDAGSNETPAESGEGTDESQAAADAGASDGGLQIRLPIQQRVPVLKLPGKLEAKPKAE